jgi:hypothetical protein
MKNFLPVFVIAAALHAVPAQASGADYYGGFALHNRVDALRPLAVSVSFASPFRYGDFAVAPQGAQPIAVKAAYAYSANFSLEAGFASAGGFGTSSAGFTHAVAPGKAAGRGFDLEAVGTVPVWNHLSLLGKAGVRRVIFVQDTLPGRVYPGSALTQSKLGLGLQYHVSGSLGFRADIERYRNVGADRTVQEGEGDAFSLGLLYRF